MAQTKSQRLNLAIRNITRTTDSKGILLYLGDNLTSGEIRTILHNHFIDHPDWIRLYDEWVESNFQTDHIPRLTYIGPKQEITLDDIQVTSVYHNYKVGNYRLNRDGDNNVLIETSEKYCKKCGLWKVFPLFSNDANKAFELGNYCKECYNKIKRDEDKTYKGKLWNIYWSQLYNSRERGHPKPAYTKEWLVKRFINDPLYIKLFNEWVESGYELWLTPSIDRIDSDNPYTKDNVQVMTWKENSLKEMKRRSTPVLQYTLDGEFVKEYPSQNQAERDTGIPQANIWKVLSGERKSAGGFNWRFKE